MSDIAIAHHGIKGMKWGIRRTPEQLARASGRPVPESGESRSGRTAQKKAASATASKRTLSDLSDDELRQRISRLELETPNRSPPEEGTSASTCWKPLAKTR